MDNELNHPPSNSLDQEDKAMSDMNDIVTRIQKEINRLPSTPPDRILPRVPNHLRRVMNKAYEPEIISIGPYHRGKDHLAPMEEHKFRYLKLLLRRRDEISTADGSVAKYVKALNDLKERAANSYEKRFLEERRERFLEEGRPDDFLETMLVDGCFIVEVIRKDVAENVSSEDDDPIFRSMTLYLLKHDLLLLENQLPFFILQKLFEMTSLPNESNLVNMILRFFSILPGQGYRRIKVPIRHLLGLIHDNWPPFPQGLKAYPEEIPSPSAEYTEEVLSLCAEYTEQIPLLSPEYTEQSTAYTEQSAECTEQEDNAEAQIRCATELHEAGIKFKRAEAEGCSIFDIKFANGVLEIPKLIIEDRTESLLRNLIAYEQLWENDTYKKVTDYARFMDCLINSNKDVQLLCRSGIIDHWLGDDKVVANMFNRLLDNVMVPERSFYSETYKEVKEHCDKKWNLWKAILRHDYFNSPWALISFLAAVFLLLLTVLQTVYSLVSYYHS